MELLGYLSDISARPGSSLRVQVSTHAASYAASVVALDAPPGDTGLASRWAGSLDLGIHRGREQRIAMGSCVVVPSLPDLAPGPLVVRVAVWPTLPADGRWQGIAASCSADRAAGWWLGLAPDGCFEATVAGDGCVARVRGGRPAPAREWQQLAMTIDPEAGRLELVTALRTTWRRHEEAVETALPGALVFARSSLVLGATHCSARTPDAEVVELVEPFNGKLARPSLARSTAGSPLAAWDLGSAMGTQVRDAGPASAHGFTINGPSSAVTGPAWRGADVDFRTAPEEYDALHFHDDDLDDARWQADFELEIPPSCESGLYGVALRGEGAEDVIPFIVGPPRGLATSHTAVWLPTFTYQAYANQRWSPAEDHALEHWSMLDEYAVQPGDAVLDAHPELGLSLYDLHRDGSPCRYSSRLRPIANLRAGHRHRHSGLPREFSGDVHFLRWLRRRGRKVDLLTDDDLHREGAAAFEPYRAVVTGSHPEYVTLAMVDALETFVAGSGRLAYLGGNGLYWVTGVDEQRPHVIEVRRGHGAHNPTGDAPAGESHLSTTGEPGGLWRLRGRAPQRVVGVGMTAMGWGRGEGYVWTEASADPEVAFVSAGIDRDQPLGARTDAFPWGAAADEMDRVDSALGTPPAAIVLATSRGRHDDHYTTVPEDGPGDPAELVRADIVYAKSPGGGRVLSVGSMGWSIALSHLPDVARVTENVLDAFAAEPG